MKRNTFLKACLATSAFMTSSFGVLAKSLKKYRVEKGFMVDSGKDRSDKSITLLEGDTFYTKVSTKDTEGDIYVFESTRVKEGGPSHHFILIRMNGGTFFRVNFYLK